MALEVQHLCKDYPTRSGPLPVLRDLTLKVEKGEALARALIDGPCLLLVDEPTGNLDRRSDQAVGQLLLDLHRQENTILVVVTHSPELAKMFVRKMEMMDGRLGDSDE